MTSPAEISMPIAIGTTSLEGVPADVKEEDRRRAFGRLVREHAVILHGLARRLATHPEDAEDLVQETFLRAWKDRGRFRGDADIGTWLYRILLNVCLDRRRRHARLLRWGRAPRRPPPDPLRQAARRDLLDRVFEAVAGLPGRQRECLLLRVRAGLSYREVAEVMGIGEGGVKSHLVQARRTLLRCFGEEVGQ